MIETQVRELQDRLKRTIDERGFTELDVERAVGWESGTVAEVLGDAETVRLQQVLLILGVVGVDQEAFFAAGDQASRDARAGLAELKALVGSVVNLLVENGVLAADELASAVAAQALARGRATSGER